MRSLVVSPVKVLRQWRLQPLDLHVIQPSLWRDAGH